MPHRLLHRIPPRLRYLLCLSSVLLGLFALAKLAFLLYTRPPASSLSLTAVGQVLVHGFSLDLAVLGYLLVLPLLLVAGSLLRPEVAARRLLRPYHLFLALLLPLILLVDAGLYPYWGFKLDATIFQYLDHPAAAAASVSLGFILAALLLYLALALGLYWILQRCSGERWLRGRRPVLAALSYLLLLGPSFVAIRGGLGKSTSNVGQVYFSQDPWLNHAAVNPVFSFVSSLAHVEDLDAEYNAFSEEERARLVAGLYPAADGPLTDTLLRTQRPNVLLIIMESFGARFVGSFGGDAAVSPQLDRLAREGVRFERCYANSYRTDRGTVCLLSGYPSFPRHSVMKMPAQLRSLSGIAAELQRVGYTTDFVYGGDANFTNTKGYLLGSGYQRVTDVTGLSSSLPRNSWGVHDEATLDYVYQQIISRPKGKPWHIGLLTLSSHEPWDVPYQRLEGKERNAFAYLDAQLGRFVDRLRQRPEWQDLLIICVADHGYHRAEDAGSRHGLATHHIPMLWLGGALRGPRSFGQLMTQTDLAATLLAQLGLSSERFAFSRNVLGTDYRYPFAYYTFNDGFAYIDSTGYSVVDNATGQCIEEAGAGAELRRARGRALLQTSYDDLARR